MKKLGPRPTPSDIRAVNERVFARATELWNQEFRNITGGFLDRAKRQLQQLNVELKSNGMLAKLLGGGSANATKSAPSAAPPAPKAPTRNASAGSATSEGAAGAKDISFGAGQKDQPAAKPNVVNGIIQDR